MKKVYSILLCTMIIILTFSQNILAMERDYVLEGERRIPIPLTYETVKVVTSLEGLGMLNHPEDMFMDSKGFIYVADTGNNRVIKLNKEMKPLAVFTGPKEKPLNDPQGIYVDDDGDMYIADKGNSRILCLSKYGEYKKEYVKPESKLLSKDFTFDLSKVYINSTGYLFALKSSSFISIDEQNNFRGYVGAKEVGFDFRQMLIRMFASKEQRNRVAKKQPDSYTNFVIANDGMIYASLGNIASGQIRKINSIGKNIYPNKMYGEMSRDKSGKPVMPNFSDIAVNKDGIISVIDQNLGTIYQYDQEGNLLAVFGGKGEIKGTFQMPSSLVMDDDGRIYVLDSMSNTVQILEPSNFIKLIHKAVTLYSNGNYGEAMKSWQEVLKIDANYTLAHVGIAKVYFKEERYKEAMKEYRIADNTGGYSKAFAKYRHEIFRKHFVVVFITVILGALALFQLLKRLIKRSNIIVREFTMGKGEA